MSGDFRDPNPYAVPASPYGMQRPVPPPAATGKVLAPAIVLTVVALLGLGFSIFNFIFALGPPPPVDPNMPQWLQEVQKNSTGPRTAVLQGIFVLVNCFIIAGAVQMMRLKTWGLAVASSIVAMLNFGTFCCILGFPVGVWSIIVLMMEDVRAMFRANQGI